MKVLVTGHLGYIGSVLAPMLAEAGHEVVGLDCDYYRRCTFGPGLAQFPALIKDIRDVTLDDVRGFDAICHLAALSNDPLGNLDPDLTYDINYRASVRLAELAKQAGVQRFIFSSSCSLYGLAGDDFLTEDSPFNPVTPYGESKVLTEQEVTRLADGHFSPVFLRNATAYGVSPRLRFDLVLNNLMAWAFTTGKIYMKSDGSPWRPLAHIRDISRAFLAVLEAPRELVHNQAFNVGSTRENLRVRAIAEIVSQTIPGCQVEFAPGASPDTRNYRVNCDKITKVLTRFQPQWNVAKGAHELFQAYREQGITLNEFEGPRYQRIAHIRQLIGEGILDKGLRFQQLTPAAAAISAHGAKT